jgi:TolA-binding protein
VLNHDRFDELASLAAIGELSPQELEEFCRHKETCSICREVVAETSFLATAAFLAGAPADEDEPDRTERNRRLRESIGRRLPILAPAAFSQRHKRLVAAGIAAAFVLGVGAGTAVGFRRTERATAAQTIPAAETQASRQTQPIPQQAKLAQLQATIADLQKRVEGVRADNRQLQEKLSSSDQHAVEVETKLGEMEKRANRQAEDVQQARNDLSAALSELTQAKESVNASQNKIETLQFKLADRETRLTEVSANLDREREMLSAGREIRDIMGARELHIVDVIDRDSKGRTRRPFGRAFYTQGKSLIFYAFDLPAKNTADGKFVYAAWGSNSNNQNGKVAHSLGIFYNDDQTQHRWAMKFDDPKLLEEIDTVFVTLEPSGKPFAAPSGKPILEAYFGTPPNHP